MEWKGLRAYTRLKPVESALSIPLIEGGDWRSGALIFSNFVAIDTKLAMTDQVVQKRTSISHQKKK